MTKAEMAIFTCHRASVLTMPNLVTGKLEINNNGMVDKVYEFLESDGFKRIYSGKAAIKVMLKSNLLAKINNQAQ